MTAGVDAVLTALRTTVPSPCAAVVLRREHRYFATNGGRMDYPVLRRNSFPIGSGVIESAADQVIRRRMKRAGMRWSDAGGDALRARLRSRRPLAA